MTNSSQSSTEEATEPQNCSNIEQEGSEKAKEQQNCDRFPTLNPVLAPEEYVGEKL